MKIIDAIILGASLVEAAAKGVRAAQEARDMVARMAAEGRDPTDAEWEALNAATDALHHRIQGR